MKESATNGWRVGNQSACLISSVWFLLANSSVYSYIDICEEIWNLCDKLKLSD